MKDTFQQLLYVKIKYIILKCSQFTKEFSTLIQQFIDNMKKKENVIYLPSTGNFIFILYSLPLIGRKFLKIVNPFQA